MDDKREDNQDYISPINHAEQRADAVLRSCGVTPEQGRKLVASLRPQDEYEHAAGLQIIASQQMSLHLLHEACKSNYLPAARQFTNLSASLMEKQIKLIDSLHRHRLAKRSEKALEATILNNEG